MFGDDIGFLQIYIDYDGNGEFGKWEEFTPEAKAGTTSICAPKCEAIISPVWRERSASLTKTFNGLFSSNR